MITATRRCLVGFALTGSLLAATVSFGQNWNAASLLYSRGVHSYFVGRDDEAEDYLSRSIASNPNDPRPYYFRAMSRLRQGRVPEAQQDMQAGAVVEARAPSRYAVGSALERVQGEDRLMLEEFRRSARLNEATNQDNRNRTRYEHVIDQEPEVLRHAVDVPLDQLVQPSTPEKLMKDGADSAARAPLPRPATPGPQEKTLSPPPRDDPFSDDQNQPTGASTAPVPAQPGSLGKPAPTTPDSTEEDVFGVSREPSSTDQSPPTPRPTDQEDEEDPFGSP
jgi:hypothetical protein